MPGIPLLSLNPTFREKVINKLEIKSYFRIQRTCRELNDFIRSSHNICVHFEGNHKLFFHTDLVCNPYAVHFLIHLKREADCDALYGTRVGDLIVYEERKGFEECCELLAQNRITCAELYMNNHPKWSTKQCETIVNILKPRVVHLNSRGSDRYEALVRTNKPPEKVDVDLNSNSLVVAVPKLLSTLQKVSISVSDSPGRFFVFRQILEVLDSHPFPNLRYFHFQGNETRPEMTKWELDEEFPGFDWIWKIRNIAPKAYLEGRCGYFPGGTTYIVVVNAVGYHESNTYDIYGPNEDSISKPPF